MPVPPLRKLSCALEHLLFCRGLANIYTPLLAQRSFPLILFVFAVDDYILRSLTEELSSMFESSVTVPCQKHSEPSILKSTDPLATYRFGVKLRTVLSRSCIQRLRIPRMPLFELALQLAPLQRKAQPLRCLSLSSSSRYFFSGEELCL